MLVKVISDIHLETMNRNSKYLLEKDKNHNEKDIILILAGDITSCYDLKKATYFFEDVSERFKKILYVPGNHEYYNGNIDHIDDFLCDHFNENYNNIHYLQMDSMEIDGVMFSGATLWTDIDKGNPVTETISFKMSDYNMIYMGDDNKKLTVGKTKALNSEHLEFIENTLKEYFYMPNVVITHYSPSYMSVTNEWKGDGLNPFFHNELYEFIKDQQWLTLWCHGHIHSTVEYDIGRTRILANPRGYTWEYQLENEKYNPYRVLDLERL